MRSGILQHRRHLLRQATEIYRDAHQIKEHVYSILIKSHSDIGLSLRAVLQQTFCCVVENSCDSVCVGPAVLGVW